MQACLPQDKFDRITALLEEWSQKRWCKRKEPESLIGHLQLACMVVLQGRSFMGRMINLLFSSLWPPNSSHSGVLSWPSQEASGFPVLEWLQLPSVSSVDSTGRLQGFFRYLWGSWLRSSFPGSQVFRRMARKTGFSVHQVQGPLPCCRGNLPLGSPYGPSNGSTSYQITAQRSKFCSLRLQEPLPSCPWFAICPYWQLDIPPFHWDPS